MACQTRITHQTNVSNTICLNNRKNNNFLTNHVIYNDKANFDVYSIFRGFTKFSQLI